MNHRWAEKHLGQAVTKAFNNIHAEHLMKYGKPAGDKERIALPVAGDDPAASAVITGSGALTGVRRGIGARWRPT